MLVDEAQFLTQRHVLQLCEVADDSSIPVLCYGLRTDFQGKLFPGSAALLALADALIELKAVCECGRKATMNLRVDAEGQAVAAGAQTEIGGNDRYIALCRRHFFERLTRRRSPPADARVSPGHRCCTAGSFSTSRCGLGSTTAVSAVKRAAARGAAIPRSRSAMAARSIRWPAACCRSRSARRPSLPGGCSTRQGL